MHHLRSFLPPVNFITIHYAYFILVPLVASLVFWGSSNPKLSISYVDSLFLVTSAMTEAGLNTVNLSQMTTWQQVLLWLLIIIGSSTWVSIWTVLVRKHAFEVRFQEIVRKERKRSLDRRNTSLTLLPITRRLRSLGRSKTVQRDHDDNPPHLDHSSPSGSTPGPVLDGANKPAISHPSDGRLLSAIIPSHQDYNSRDDVVSQTQRLPHTHTADSLSHPRSLPPLNDTASEPTGLDDARDSRLHPGNGDHVAFVDNPHARSTSLAPSGLTARRHVSSTDTAINHPGYSGGHKAGRNGQFHGLTSEEREELGGTEYRALKLLSIVVPLYSFSWQFLGCISLGAWLANKQPQPAVDNAISPWWNGIFNGVSAFNNSGMSVLDMNMIPYGSSYFVLIVMGAMILAGNTAYPVFLRLCFWCSCKYLPQICVVEGIDANTRQCRSDSSPLSHIL